MLMCTNEPACQCVQMSRHVTVNIIYVLNAFSRNESETRRMKSNRLEEEPVNLLVFSK